MVSMKSERYDALGQTGTLVDVESKEKLCQQKIMDLKFRLPRLMLHLTGLVYHNELNPFWRFLKILRAVILIGLSLHQTGFILKRLLERANFDLVNSRSLITFSWLLKALISMGFLMYWQFLGYMPRLRENIHCPNGCPKILVVIRRTVILNTFFLALISLLSSVTLFFKLYNVVGIAAVGFDEKLDEMFGSKKLNVLVYLVYFWSTYCWLSIFTSFICIVTVLEHELCAFNIMKLEKIGEGVGEVDGDHQQQREKIAEQLQDCFEEHVGLATRVRNIDSIFEVYTFAMIGSNLPTTIFCLLNFLLSLQYESWLSIAFSIPDLLYCIIELIGLTQAPAKVHARIRDIEGIIYGNMRIWKPYSDKVYRLANVFISHAKQSSLGITLWGFAVVTKPLLFTMISLTITYLTVVLQTRQQQDAVNGTRHFGHI